MNKKIYVFALAAFGEGISGGDRISIELIRRWSKFIPITVYLSEEGLKMYLRQNLNPREIRFEVINMDFWKRLSFLINYIARIFAGILLAFRIKLENEKNTVVYCATEFLMDSIPGFILKKRFPRITLINTWFQTAPNPFVGYKEGERASSYRLRSFPYYLVQLLVKPFIKKNTDFVLVNNENEREQFFKMNKEERVIVTLGAVDFKRIETWRLEIGDLPKKYDGVFQGRFHPQKGILELIDIWNLVVAKKKDAKLALIGDGPLMDKVRKKIIKLKLQKKIKLFGYVFDGIKKYKIFAQSRVVLHPAFYDSGGMASAEAMALGLPAVGFNLAAYDSYYPKGMVKVPVNNLHLFAETILELLQDKKLYSEIGSQAKVMIAKNWSWDSRAKEILDHLK